MNNVKEKNSFLITCVSCIVLLLTLCYFGINNSLKGTQASSGYWNCPNGGFADANGVCSKTDSNLSTADCGSGYTTSNCSPTTDGKYQCICSYQGTWVSTGTGDTDTGTDNEGGDTSTDEDTSNGDSDTENDSSNEESKCISGSACFWVAEAYVWAEKSRFCRYSGGTCICSPQPEELTQSQCKNSWDEEDDNNSSKQCWSCSNGYIYGSAEAYQDSCQSVDNSYCDNYLNGNNTCGSTDYGSWEQSTCEDAGHKWNSSNKCCQLSSVPTGNTCGLEDYNKWTADSCLADSPTNVWSGDSTGNFCCDLNAAIGTGNTCGSSDFNTWTKDTCTGSWIANDTNGYCCSMSSSGNTGGTSGSGSGSSGGNSSSGNNNSSNNNTGGSTSGGSTTNPDSSNTGTNTETNNGSDNNVSENPGTGQIVMFIVLFVGLAAIVYSGWYFKNLVKSN